MLNEFIDVGYSEGLMPFLYWMLFGGILALIVQQLFANPKTRRAQFRGQAYPRAGFATAAIVLVIFFFIGLPMFISRFYAVTVTEETFFLHYPLSEPIALSRDDVIKSGINRYTATKTLWQGQSIFIDTKEGYRYRSIVSRKTINGWQILSEYLK